MIVCGFLTSGLFAADNCLDIYLVDTEGGAATLIVTPTKETILIDCGNPGGRDGDRIAKVFKDQLQMDTLDHLIITHWHTDHYGGVARLSQQIKINNYYHHGIPKTLEEDPKNFPLLIAAFREASKGKDKRLNPGDYLELKQTKDAPKLSLLCLCGDGKVIDEPKDAKPNPIAKEHKPQAEDKSDNAKSLGFILKFGDFKFLDLGDLTWNIEYQLVHPSDKIGPVDVYQSTHHGLNISNNTVLLKTVKPHVAIFNNGSRKGGAASVLSDLRQIPEVKAIYQIHRNLTIGAKENTDPELIANPNEKCEGEGIKLSVAPDGKSYSIVVGKREKGRTYEVRK
jgi:competence protein ComEC